MSNPAESSDSTLDTVHSRGRGRPRHPRISRAILDATLEILEEEGFAGLTIEAISTRAGVGRPALYRRWPSKEAIVEEALLGVAGELVPVPDTGSLRGDLTLLVREFADSMDTTAGRLTVALIAEAIRDPSWHPIVRDFLRRRRALTRVVIDRAIQRGELPPDADGDLLIDLVASPLWVHRLLHWDLAEWIDPDAILDGILAHRWSRNGQQQR